MAFNDVYKMFKQKYFSIQFSDGATLKIVALDI